MEKITGLIITLCWIIFLGYWCISALLVKRTAERKSWSSSLAYRVPVLLGVILIWGGLFRPHGPPPWIIQTDAMQIIAAAVCVGGLLVSLWARTTLAGNWSSTVTFKQGHELIRAGPYRLVRHPIYTGILLMLLAGFLATGWLQNLLGLALISIGFWIKLKQEEELMLQHFPDQYPAYRQEVKALVPWVI